MEIDITAFVDTETPEFYSASQAEMGPDAGKLTWAASMEAAERISPPMLDTEDKLDEARDYFGAMGAWDRAEIAAWTPQHVNAMFIQEVSARMRDDGIKAGMMEDDWLRLEDGEASGLIYRGNDGRIYFYLGS